ncbi:hypothetical protein GC176_04690 [bacterium]|nr:hypothetical protein [bacterium]
MRIQRLWKSTLVILTGIAVALPGPVMAGQAPSGEEAREKEARGPAVQIRDVSLDAGGVLSGYLVDAQGKPEAESPIQIHQGRKQIAVAKTNARGHFEVRGLKGGVYQVSSSKGSSLFRIWKNGTAPKQASRLALVVNDDPVVRAQPGGFLGLGGFGGGASLTTLAIGAGVIAGGTIAIVEATNNDNPDVSP